jgi:hypothetical protein
MMFHVHTGATDAVAIRFEDITASDNLQVSGYYFLSVPSLSFFSHFQSQTYVVLVVTVSTGNLSRQQSGFHW